MVMTHPRIKIRALAEVEHMEALLKIIKKYDLTYGEIFTILSGAITRWAMHLKSDEDKEKKKNPDWIRTKPLGKLIDNRPIECQSCDYDFYEDCREGCQKL